MPLRETLHDDDVDKPGGSILLKNKFSLMGSGAIGISIECDALRIAESCSGHVMRCAEFPYPVGTAPDTDAFALFLKDRLTAFCPRYRHLPVWVSSGIPDLQVRYLLLPPAASGAVGDMVYWAFRKDLPFVVSQTLFDYDVEMHSGSAANARMHVMAYTAPREEVESLAAMLGQAQIHPAGIVIPPFPIRNLVRLEDTVSGGASLCVFAGAEATTLLIVRDGHVHACRVFKTGMNALLGVVAEHVPGLAPASALVRVDAALSAPAPGAVDMQIRDVVKRILQQIELSLSVYMNEHVGESVDNLHVMGSIAGIEAFTSLLEERLGLSVKHVSLPAACFPDGVDSADCFPRDTLPDRMALAAGAALSRREHMPNLLYTCRERETLARRARWSAFSLMLAALGVALLHLAHSVCGHMNLQLQHCLGAEQNRLVRFTPHVDQAMLAGMASKTLSDGLLLKRLAAHWLPFAVFHPLMEQLSPDIQLSALSYTAVGVGDAARVPRNASSTSGGKTAVLAIRGVVDGEPALQRSKLASFAMRLEDTPLIEHARTVRISDGAEGDADVLSFEIEASLVDAPMANAASEKEVDP